MKRKIGFVGLETMGFPIAENLKKGGSEVIGYDAYKGVYKKAAATGITMVESLREVAQQADEAIIPWLGIMRHISMPLETIPSIMAKSRVIVRLLNW